MSDIESLLYIFYKHHSTPSVKTHIHINSLSVRFEELNMVAFDHLLLFPLFLLLSDAELSFPFAMSTNSVSQMLPFSESPLSDVTLFLPLQIADGKRRLLVAIKGIDKVYYEEQDKLP